MFKLLLAVHNTVIVVGSSGLQHGIELQVSHTMAVVKHVKLYYKINWAMLYPYPRLIVKVSTIVSYYQCLTKGIAPL